jgi:SAM-dependent methyltransferase
MSASTIQVSQPVFEAGPMTAPYAVASGAVAALPQEAVVRTKPPRKIFPQHGQVPWLAYCEYLLLRWVYADDPDHLNGRAYEGRSKLECLFGPGVFHMTRGKTVIDFGCGYGDQTIELAKRGAKLVIGLDIREEVLDVARRKAAGMTNVRFLTPQECPTGSADYVISLDSFEHFENPSAMLDLINDLLCPGGRLLSSFGPPWKHPFGGHSFSAFPWAHLLLNESALVGWYNQVKERAISRIEEVSGGLNRMTVARFEELVRASKFRKASITPVPIRKLRLFYTPLTREFTTAVVKCQLTK